MFTQCLHNQRMCNFEKTVLLLALTPPPFLAVYTSLFPWPLPIMWSYLTSYTSTHTHSLEITLLFQMFFMVLISAIFVREFLLFIWEQNNVTP